MSRWWRSYADKHRNPKVARLSDADFRLWDQLLCVASENDGLIPAVEDLKHLLNRRLDHLSSGLKRLVDGRLIEPLNGGYAPTNWSEKQYKSDTSTPRVQKYRAERNVTGNASETPPDTDTDTDTETETEKTTNVVLPRKARRKTAKPLRVDWKPEPFGKQSSCFRIVCCWERGRWESEVEAFKAHHGSRANVMADWQAAWRTWVLNSEKFDRSRDNGNGTGRIGKSAAAFALLNPSNDERF